MYFRYFVGGGLFERWTFSRGLIYLFDTYHIKSSMTKPPFYIILKEQFKCKQQSLSISSLSSVVRAYSQVEVLAWGLIRRGLSLKGPIRGFMVCRNH